MRSPSSFCTIATYPAKYELEVLLYSLSVHHPGATVFILSDRETYLHMNGKRFGLKEHWRIGLDAERVNVYDRGEKAKGFFMRKADVIELAMAHAEDTLFLDADQVVLAPLEVDDTKALGVAPAFLKSEISDRVGYYSGGLMWVANDTIPDTWRYYANSSRYVDQAAIEDLVRSYFSFHFDEGYNFRCWRFKFGEDPANVMREKTTVENGAIYYDGVKVRTVHTHFHDPKFIRFNSWFIGKMMQAGMDGIVRKISAMPYFTSKACSVLGRVM